MKQKIIIKVSMHCSKCRTKALRIASGTEGVTSVALHGPEKDKLMIIGDEVDAAELTDSLRKKLCHASLETVEEVEENTRNNPVKKPTPPPIIQCVNNEDPPQPQVEFYIVVADPSPPPCTIM